jgi:hypothetical protein
LSRVLQLFFCAALFWIATLGADLEKITYRFSLEPIDVVIPCASKDRDMLARCIQGVRRYGQNIRRIIVVSKERLSLDAEWFSEDLYPFTKEDLSYEIFHGNKKKSKRFLSRKHPRIGWIFQQFLKLYAPFVIPGISSNVLIVDADLIFIQPTSFMNEKGEPLFNMGEEYYPPYFAHMERVLPELRRVQQQYSGITHHMLFQKPILEDLFSLISEKHQMAPWRALCRVIDPKEAKHSALSEYEIYFNFVQLRTDQMQLRPLRFINVSPLKKLEKYKSLGYHYVTSHNYL